ncbi:MAG: neutral/alkaline non-lysosomal ceramidase N-terminal domain-containing protein [Agathobaculum sp.]|uniref:neutral/alkaline non-lysosomal ceramidase N-terminal domain-containing protein n=1 Tax=Agathobaculum sp. TaxID=2048138 RepID=UPI003D9205E9
MNQIKAGAMRTVITGPIGLPLAGCRTDRYTTGKKEELYARAVVIEADETVALVTCDVLAVDEATVARIRQFAYEGCGIQPENILICATHTHTAMATVPIFNTVPDPAYMEFFVRAVAGAIVGAHAAMKPAKLTYGMAREDSISFNRRVILKDGTVIIGGLEDETPVDTIREIEGEIDPDIGVIGVKDESDQYIAVISNFSCHCDIVTGKEYSSDYPTYVERELNSMFQGDFPVLVLTGAAGDINHLNVMDPEAVASRSRYFDPLGQEHCAKFSKVLAAQMALGLCKATPMSAPRIAVSCDGFDADLRAPRESELSWAEEILKQDDVPLKEQITAKEIFRLQQMQKEEKIARLEIQLMRIGPVDIVAVPCEVFCEIGVALKKMCPGEITLVSTLTNGYDGYMITEKAYHNGGYEAQAAFSSKLSEHAGEELIKHVHARLTAG